MQDERRVFGVDLRDGERENTKRESVGLNSEGLRTKADERGVRVGVSFAYWFIFPLAIDEMELIVTCLVDVDETELVGVCLV